MNKIIHPFLLALFPILILYSGNMSEVPATDIIIPSLIVLAMTSVLIIAIYAINKNWEKSGIVVCLATFLLFVLGFIRGLINANQLKLDSVVLIIIGLFLLIVFAALTIKISKMKNEIMITKMLNLVCFSLVLSATIYISFNYITESNLMKKDWGYNNLQKLTAQTDSLNIYYIILDEYAGKNELEKDFGYNNNNFIKSLKDRGFYVADDSKSNYPDTYLSLSSSLNMSYLNNEHSEEIFHRWVNSGVMYLFKNAGYNTIYIGGNMNHLEIEKYVDNYYASDGISLDRNDFGNELERVSPLFGIFNLYTNNSDVERKSILYSFDKLNEISKNKGPFFVYDHILCPHIPYLFDENGNCPVDSVIASDNDKEAYIGQLEYVNIKVIDAVDKILENDHNAVIIVQSDHGWRGAEDFDDHYDILNAYYFPDHHSLYKTISPVNSFREIFNYYFGTNYEILKDEKTTF